MKRKSISTVFVMTVALFALFEAATAQVNYMNQITVENQSISKRAGTTNIDMDFILNNLRLDKNDMLIITPVVISGKNEVELEPIAVKGSLRNKVLERPFEWKGKTHLSMPAENQVIRRNGTHQSLHYKTTLPFEEWQRQAQLVLKTEIIGCTDCSEAQPDKLISQKILPDKFTPNYRMPYVVPEMEPVKQRSERYSAYLNYVVARHDIRPNFENNAAVLAQVDKIIQELKADKDLTITDFTISGYASPEGNEKSNLLLSKRRAESFARYMERKYGYTRDQFKVEWFGEDWDGLRKAVEKREFADKEAVLRIIDNVPVHDGRKKQIMKLSGGNTYRWLLAELFPPLRRNDYNIAFVSRAFNVDEAKEIIKTKPNLLSLNEMFLVAKTYPEDSPEYKKVFDIACETFPNAEVPCLNAAVGALRANKADAALRHLQKCPDSPMAMNLTGIAYAQKGDTAMAKQFFDKAVRNGNTDARYNTEQLQQYIEDNL
ncbi:MAG: DUF3868 domain-containing protein [Proteiniphilum sp.]|nr:DUF3868 domain-containing protein [Proteiniphilum sp.]MDD3908818.1 DUF3868 domain-containing protein [Proteiniphilum sp.]